MSIGKEMRYVVVHIPGAASLAWSGTCGCREAGSGPSVWSVGSVSSVPGNAHQPIPRRRATTAPGCSCQIDLYSPEEHEEHEGGITIRITITIKIKKGGICDRGYKLPIPVSRTRAAPGAGVPTCYAAGIFNFQSSTPELQHSPPSSPFVYIRAIRS
jgi:hypothetical protein